MGGLLMLKLNQKLLLMLDLDTEVMVDTVMVAIEDTEDTEAMVVSDTEDSMERDLLMLKPNQKLLLMLMLVTLEDTAMGDTVMVAMEDTEAMEAMVDLDTGDSMEKDLLRLKLDLDVMVDMDIVAMEDTEATVDLDTGDFMERDLLMLNQKLMLAILDTEVMLDMEDMDMVDIEAMVDMAAIEDTEDTDIMDKKNEIRISTNLSKWKISRLQYQRN